ncbi:FecCD family ABC transporter permease [Rothia nasimurium]|uniref:FecCD family ABC transporter permease n=1 Tax=Rothia nasimurium TaxID=85336 RepID=UPI001F28D44F|nr:iron ABC transporter permease [Rothia nasimurium]
MKVAPVRPPSSRRATPAGGARRLVVLSLALGLLLALAALASFGLGARPINLTTLLDYLAGGSVAEADAAVLTQRSVRTLTAGLVGAALGLAGAGLQGITRNPLGDPGILGINAGAACAVVAGITFFSADSTAAFALWAFAGAVVSAVAVYALASLGAGGATPIKLALMGAALTAGLGAVTSALILTNQNTLDNLRRWQIGTVAGADLSDMAVAAPLLAVGALIVLTGAKTINSFALGDDMAASLGENVAVRRLVITGGVTLLVGTALALAGPIAFLGLMAPHAMRALAGADYRTLLPLSALFGAALLILADTAGRVIAPPQEIQVGVMMVALGVPVFIYLVRRGKAVNL